MIWEGDRGRVTVRFFDPCLARAHILTLVFHVPVDRVVASGPRRSARVGTRTPGSAPNELGAFVSDGTQLHILVDGKARSSINLTVHSVH